MKDYSRAAYEESRPEHDALYCLDFCLDALFKDKKHKANDEFVEGCSYEELIGALLLAKDAVEDTKCKTED